jgi:uncharacterized membrane protein
VKRWLCLLVVLCCLAAAPSAAARSYELLDLDISAQVGADAVVRITETLRVRFNGTYSGMYRYFDTSRGIAIKDLFVSERGTDYQQSPGETPGPAGTFFVKEEKEQLLVDWSFSATDEIREFEISYSLHNAILKHNDVAEFYYQFVGTGWELPWQHVRVVLTLPQGAEADQVAAWGYGPQHGKVTVESPSRIIWEVANHPAESFLEGRVVFPNALVPLGTRYTNQNGLDRILREEQVREERQKRAEQRKAFDPFVAAVVLAAAILLVINIWRRFLKSQPVKVDRYFRELPGDYPPAELGVLYRGSVQGRDFTATLLDLARRGFLSIEEITDTAGRRGRTADFRFKRQPVDEEQMARLLPYEKQVIKLLFSKLGGEEVTLADLKGYAQKKSREFLAFWKGWGEAVQKATEGRGFRDQGKNKQAQVFFLPALGLILLAIPAGLLGMYLTLGICIVMGLALLFLAVGASSQLSQYGREQKAKWKAFRRYLKDFSRVEQAHVARPGVWEEFLPYAVTLGVADEVLEQLEVVFPEWGRGDHYMLPWFIFYHSSSARALNDMTNSVTRSIDSVTIPQGTGGSGGFSSGGGGGFGGGGGGAR